MAQETVVDQPVIPSYAIANSQLQDLVRAQTSVIARLQYLAEKKDDSVSIEDYENLRQKFQNEKIAHLQTKAKLSSLEKELQFALSEIASLQSQLENEKSLFRRKYSEMKNKADVTSQENDALLAKCTEIREVCGHQDDILTVKDVKINDLKTRLAKQTQSYRAAASEAELKLQQERFMNAQNLRNEENKIKKFVRKKKK